jgi:hypothetical protein
MWGSMPSERHQHREEEEGATLACASGSEGPMVCPDSGVILDAQSALGGGGDIKARYEKVRREMQHMIYFKKHPDVTVAT